MSSYFAAPSVNSSSLKCFANNLHLSRCCWSSFSSPQREQSMLVRMYFCLKFVLQSVERDLSAWSMLTSSLVKVGHVMYACISRLLYLMSRGCLETFTMKITQ